MNEASDHDLCEHAQSLRGLARALVGPMDAEDLVQDTVVRALDQSNLEVRSMGGWLARVMRNLASSRRIADARRNRREQLGADGGSSEAPPAISAASRMESIERLHAALRSLDEPYRGALLLRYFEGLTPPEMAAHTSEPLATIKSRLRRGLDQLRAKLDARTPQQDWRGAFGAAFGLGSLAPTSAAAAGLITLGWILMSWKTLCGAVAAIALTLWWWSAIDVAPPTSPAGTAAPGVAAAKSGVDVDVNVHELLRNERDQLADVAVDEPKLDGVTFVGRAVDEQEQPLANVSVVMSVLRSSDNREAERAQVQTGIDGRFEVVVAQPAEHRFELTLTLDGRLPITGGWRELDSSRRDLGDLLVPVPCLVRGRVVDEAGVPQAGVQLKWTPRAKKRHVRPSTSVYPSIVVSANDGTFAMRGAKALGPDAFEVSTPTHALIRPRGFVNVLQGQREREVEVVLAAELPACRGLVVDAAGAPVAGVSVTLGEVHAKAGEDGRFKIRPKLLRVDRDNTVWAYQPGWKSASASWDGNPSTVVRIVMQPEPGLTLRVVDGAGAAIERFAVWTMPQMAWPFAPTLDTMVHPRGITNLRLRPDQRLICIEVPGEPTRWSPVTAIELVEGATVEKVVTVFEPLRRRLRLRAGGAPVVGATCELVDRAGLPVTDASARWPMRERQSSGLGDARLIEKGATDEEGTLWLEGPPGPLHIIVTGAGLPAQTHAVALRGDGDLVVDVVRGGVVRGKLVPQSVVQRLLALGQYQEEQRGARRFGLRLSGEGVMQPWVLSPPLAFDAHGAFEIQVKPGTYRLLLDGFGKHMIDELTVADGAVVARTFDITHLDPAVLDLRLRIDGEVAANAFINAMGTHGRDASGRARTTQHMGNADEFGAVRVLTLPGTLSLRVSTRPAEGRGQSFTLNVPVSAPGTRTLDVSIQTSRLDLSLKSPEGAALANREVVFGPQPWQSIGRTDKLGRLRVDPFAAGAHQLYVWPTELVEHEARQAFEQSFGQAALHARLFELEAVVISPGASTPQVRVVSGD